MGLPIEHSASGEAFARREGAAGNVSGAASRSIVLAVRFPYLVVVCASVLVCLLFMCSFVRLLVGFCVYV